MRIQHNIMAMNAYRNYNNNNKALSGNLEKLSSGYKINRAGDDAAGLAISEKMRAQITGLDAAQKNVKDGISLVKTAEGAMQEIQDMLNRMDYLATQSANGTYDNEVDRANLQKEIVALRSEIDRIADSANFNGIKLLDGSRDPNASQNSAAAVKAAEKSVADAEAALEIAKKEQEAAAAAVDNADNLTENRALDNKKDLIQGGVLLDKSTAATGNVPTNAGTYTLTQKDKQADNGLGFDVTFDGVTHVLKAPNNSTSVAMTVTVGSYSVTISEKDIADVMTDAKAGDTADAEDIAKAIANKINGTAVTVGSAAGTAQYTVEANGDKLEFRVSGEIPTTAIVASFDVSMEGMQGSYVGAAKHKYATGAVSVATGTTMTGNLGVTVNYTSTTGATRTATVTATIGTANATSAANAIADAINNDATLKNLFTATVSGTQVVLESKKGGAAGTSATATGQAVATGITLGTLTGYSATTTGAGVAVTGANAYTTGTDGYLNFGTQDVTINSADNRKQLASTGLNLDQLDLKDGMKIKVGDKEVVLAIGDKSSFKNADNRVDLTKFTVDQLSKATNGSTATAELKEATALIANALNDGNNVFTVGHDGAGQITIKQTENAATQDATKMYTAEDVWKHIKVETSVAASAEAIAAEKAKLQAVADEKAEAVDAKQALLDKAKESLKATEAKAEKAADGKALKLQIGDTSDGFNQLEVKIGDMHTYAMFTAKRNSDGTIASDDSGVIYDRTAKSINDIDISSQKGAAEAVQTIKDAINYVSGIRGDLGAVQNRLDHTANNLSVMAENIQDAESTIRDTDVADEMMKYVKNNILVQSAQAMLAQANQVPQGVLQLLG